MMFNRILLFTLLLAFKLQAQTNDVKMKWWTDGKFGLFLHWGLYSVTAGDWNGHKATGNEHFMLYEKIPYKRYGEIGKNFNPTGFNADKWVSMAKNAGMKYIVITTKHHDGFAMYDSKVSDFNIVKLTPYAKDPIKQLADACKKYNIKLCFYYSLGRDWQDPDVPTNWPVKAGRSNTWDFPNEDGKVFQRYFDRKVLPQVTELLSNYGPIGIVWFDTPELINKQQSETLQKLIHKLQPDCIINNRIGNGFGDYAVSEQKIADKIDLKSWESCITMSEGWGFNKYDTAWKKPELLIRQLTDVVSNGGNLLLNVGPNGEGNFPKPSIERLKLIGKWMEINNEAIYGVRPWKISSELPVGSVKPKEQNSLDKKMMDVLNDGTSKAIFPEIRFTRKHNNVYAFLNNFETKTAVITALSKTKADEIIKVKLLGSSKTIKWEQTDAGLKIYLNEKPIINNVNNLAYKIEFKQSN